MRRLEDEFNTLSAKVKQGDQAAQAQLETLTKKYADEYYDKVTEDINITINETDNEIAGIEDMKRLLDAGPVEKGKTPNKRQLKIQEQTAEQKNIKTKIRVYEEELKRYKALHLDSFEKQAEAKIADLNIKSTTALNTIQGIRDDSERETKNLNTKQDTFNATKNELIKQKAFFLAKKNAVTPKRQPSKVENLQVFDIFKFQNTNILTGVMLDNLRDFAKIDKDWDAEDNTLISLYAKLSKEGFSLMTFLSIATGAIRRKENTYCTSHAEGLDVFLQGDFVETTPATQKDEQAKLIAVLSEEAYKADRNLKAVIAKEMGLEADKINQDAIMSNLGKAIAEIRIAMESPIAARKTPSSLAGGAPTAEPKGRRARKDVAEGIDAARTQRIAQLGAQTEEDAEDARLQQIAKISKPSPAQEAAIKKQPVDQNIAAIKQNLALTKTLANKLSILGKQLGLAQGSSPEEIVEAAISDPAVILRDECRTKGLMIAFNDAYAAYIKKEKHKPSEPEMLGWAKGNIPPNTQAAYNQLVRKYK